MAKAIFRGGNPVMMDYTPASAVAAGDVVIVGTRPCVAHKDIAANVLGALAIHGGIYDLVKDDTSGPDIAQGEEVAWITSTNLASDVITGNKHFGWALAAAGASASTVRTFHVPHGADTNTAS